jgi:hypothetical protein
MDERNPLSLLKSVREELETVQRQVDYLIAVLDSEARSGLVEIPGSVKTGRPVDLNLINHAIEQMAGKQSQEEILEVLLARAGECADRIILFETENGMFKAWKGIGVATEVLSSIKVAEADSPLTTAVQTGEIILESERVDETLPWLSELGSTPAVCLCVPLAFGSYVPLVLYADSSTALDKSSLGLLSRLAVMQMQNHYLAHLLQQREEDGRLGSDSGESEGIRRDEAQVEEFQEAGGEISQEADLVDEGDHSGFASAELSEEEEEAAHEEARRLARLLVAEIKLYNEEEVERGRQDGDLYGRLKTDIDRSRKMYERRVHPLIQSETDYFGTELIRVLAQDDPELMGSEYRSPEMLNPIDQESG